MLHFASYEQSETTYIGIQKHILLIGWYGNEHLEVSFQVIYIVPSISVILF
jgi:hypothetical protein